MRTGLITKKLGMSAIYTDDGRHIPVTVLKVDNCQVVSQRTEEKDGYEAIQLGVGVPKVKNVSKPCILYQNVTALCPGNRTFYRCRC